MSANIVTTYRNMYYAQKYNILIDAFDFCLLQCDAIQKEFSLLRPVKYKCYFKLFLQNSILPSVSNEVLQCMSICVVDKL